MSPKRNICASVRVNMHTCLCRRHRHPHSSRPSLSCLVCCPPNLAPDADRPTIDHALPPDYGSETRLRSSTRPAPPFVLRPLAGPHLAADAEVPKPLSNRNRGVPRLIDRTYNTGEALGGTVYRVRSCWLEKEREAKSRDRFPIDIEINGNGYFPLSSLERERVKRSKAQSVA